MNDRTPEACGYASPSYAATLAHCGAPLALPGCGGTLLVREIETRRDGTGPYPLFACARWESLGADLAALRGKLVSVTLVADPFGGWTPDLLRAACPDLARPYKQHLVADLAQPAERRTTEHHRRNVRRARGQMDVVRAEPATDAADAWCDLYLNLIERHAIRGPAAFPAESLRSQLAVPGARVWIARREGRALGACVWYVCGEVASYHLAAYSAEGYERRASFALFAHALEELAACGVRWAHLGASAGAEPRDEDGLTRFKRGWATGTRDAWLCGRILDRAAYDELTRTRTAAAAGYFPSYRADELG